VLTVPQIDSLSDWKDVWPSPEELAVLTTFLILLHTIAALSVGCVGVCIIDEAVFCYTGRRWPPRPEVKKPPPRKPMTTRRRVIATLMWASLGVWFITMVLVPGWVDLYMILTGEDRWFFCRTKNHFIRYGFLPLEIVFNIFAAHHGLEILRRCGLEWLFLASGRLAYRLARWDFVENSFCL